MNDVTRILSPVEHGDVGASEQLLPLVYDELRKLSAQRLAHEKPGQTLQPTALVHEAYLRLVGSGSPPHWDGCGHFFAAAAAAMRRILVEQARRKRRLKRGGGQRREPADLDALLAGGPSQEVLALHEALEQLAARPRQSQARGDAVLRRPGARAGGRMPAHRAENSRPRLAVRAGLAVHRHGRAGIRRKMNGWWRLPRFDVAWRVLRAHLGRSILDGPCSVEVWCDG
jgi:RNA polymerase sigma factor (TIGR02999 family)